MKESSLLGIFLAVFFLCAPIVSTAQGLSSYTFATGVDAGRWIPVTSTTNVGPEGDDEASDLLPIGFSFPFGDSRYTQFSVSTNGFMRLGSVITENPYMGPILRTRTLASMPPSFVLPPATCSLV